MRQPDLSPDQQAQLSDLVAAHRLRACPVDQPKARRFLSQAADALAELPRIRASAVRADTAYNAAHDVGEALLASYGYRTASSAGHHSAVGAFLAVVLSGTPAQQAARDFNILRDARNQLRYQAKPIGVAQAAFAAATAATLLDQAQATAM